jgi:hypothetical protein
MDAEEQRCEELKVRWRALYDDRRPEPGDDEDSDFTEFVDTVGGGDLDAVEEYLQGCEQLMTDPVVREGLDTAGMLKSLGPEEAAKLSPEGLQHWFERRVFWASLLGPLPDDIPADPSVMSRDQMLAAVGEHTDIFAPKAEPQDGSREVH